MTENDDLKYACCFCKDTVSADERSHELDPCALLLIGHFDRSNNQQKEQQFFCHFICFRELVNDDGLLYIAEPGFPTVSEVIEDYSEE
ncbi:MAG: hypothetical protein KF855_00345 [Acidobacteria bacterium]|nr:hypothetical protein [Acidobacteriota bacterium]